MTFGSPLSVSQDPSDHWWETVPFRQTRVIPSLLLRGSGFVKTVKFDKPTYLGDPINIVKIFNEKEVDELVILDIMATRENRSPNFKLLADIAGECFMPLAYGGGIRTVDDIQRLTLLGFEKICINTNAVESPGLIRDAAAQFGSSTIIVSIDAKEKLFGNYEVYIRGGRKKTGMAPVEAAKQAEANGAGEILINSINRDGTMKGYDSNLIKQVGYAVSIPVIACGGAQSVDDFHKVVVECGASAVAAGSIFVFHGPRRGVLINMPTADELAQAGVP